MGHENGDHSGAMHGDPLFILTALPCDDCPDGADAVIAAEIPPLEIVKHLRSIANQIEQVEMARRSGMN